MQYQLLRLLSLRVGCLVWSLWQPGSPQSFIPAIATPYHPYPQRNPTDHVELSPS